MYSLWQTLETDNILIIRFQFFYLKSGAKVLILFRIKKQNVIDNINAYLTTLLRKTAIDPNKE